MVEKIGNYSISSLKQDKGSGVLKRGMTFAVLALLEIKWFLIN